MKSIFLLLLLVLCSQPALTRQTDSADGELARSLREVANGVRSASELTVTYDDMHGLWGGLTIRVSGAGSYERKQRTAGVTELKVRRKALTAKQVRALAVLLVQIRAWRQETPERAPVPDESRATLTIRIGSAEAMMWEWYNDMAGNNRLIQVRNQMVKLGSRLAR